MSGVQTGLRTLVLGYFDVDERAYKKWAKKYDKASQEIGHRKDKMEVTAATVDWVYVVVWTEALLRVQAIAAELEHGVRWLGVTAIEDALQVNHTVPW